jgi:hypothetical protein
MLRSYLFCSLLLLMPAVAFAEAGPAPTFKQAPPAPEPAVGPLPPAILPSAVAPSGAAPSTAAPPPSSAAASPPAPSAGPAPAYPPAAYPPPSGYPPVAYPPASNLPPGYQPPPGYAPPGYPQPGYPPVGAPPGYANGVAPAPYPYPYPYPYGYQAPAHPPGFQTHDGTYLRMQIGAGWTGLSTSSQGSSVDFKGGGASFAFALGLSVTPHLVVYLEGLEASSSNPDITVGGMASGSVDGDGNVLGVGPGLAYYFGTTNIFLAGTLLAAKAELTDHNSNAITSSKWGVGWEGLVGKEWWVSDNWGLGVSGQLIVASMKGKDPVAFDATIPSWTALSLAVLFSATYN